MRLQAHVTMSNAETMTLAIAARVPGVLEKHEGHRVVASVVRIEDAAGRGHAHSGLVPGPGHVSSPPCSWVKQTEEEVLRCNLKF